MTAIALTALTVLLLPLGHPPGAAAPVQEEGEELVRLEAWPELGGKELKQVRTEVSKLRKARTPEMAEDAAEQLAGGSVGAVPELLTALSKEKDKAALQRIEAVLEEMTGPAHTRCLAGEFEHKSALVRAWCLRRCASFPDPGVRGAAEGALERVRKSGKKADPEELYAAALCSTSAGSPEGMDVMSTWALEAWPKRGEEMRTALEQVRGTEAAAAAEQLLAGDPKEDRAEIVAGLRLLSGCGGEDSVKLVGPFLDEEDNSIRVAAINALRGIVDGEGPMEELSVFRAIEVAKTWKRRIGA